MYFNKKYLVVLFLSSLFMLVAWTPNVHADNYTVPLAVLKDGTGQTSYAASYFSNSANVVDNGDGTYVVTSTITTDKKLGNFPVQILSIDGGGANVSQADNGDSQTVTYSYQTNDLTERHNAVIKVDVDNIDYHHTYNVGLQLDASSIPAPDAEKSSSESSEDDQMKQMMLIKMINLRLPVPTHNLVTAQVLPLLQKTPKIMPTPKMIPLNKLGWSLVPGLDLV